jgi:hypothetical protein
MKLNRSVKLFLTLACLPPLSKFLSWFTPYPPLFACIMILYILTVAYLRMRCKKIDMKSVVLKGMIPIIIFVALDLFNYSLRWFPYFNNQSTMIINNYINSLLGWFVISLLTYAPIMSSQSAC